MMTVSGNDDDYFVASPAYSTFLSSDDGKTWAPSFEVPQWTNGAGESLLPLPDGTAVGPGNQPRPSPPGQLRRFAMRRETFSDGGAGYATEPGAAIVSGFAQDIFPIASPIYQAYVSSYSNIVVDPVTDRWVLGMHVIYAGGPLKWNVVTIGSTDQGRTWAVIGMAATFAQVGTAEGADENALLFLADGTLLCVMRTGGGQPCWQARSSDGGATWTAPVQMAGIGDRAPRLLRMADGTLALASSGIGGGVSLWFSLDPAAPLAAWQKLDLLTHHNLIASRYPQLARPLTGISFTTGYLGVVEIQPGTLLVIYDRFANGRVANNGTNGPNEIYAVEVQVKRE